MVWLPFTDLVSVNTIILFSVGEQEVCSLFGIRFSVDILPSTHRHFVE